MDRDGRKDNHKIFQSFHFNLFHSVLIRSSFKRGIIYRDECFLNRAPNFVRRFFFWKLFFITFFKVIGLNYRLKDFARTFYYTKTKTQKIFKTNPLAFWKHFPRVKVDQCELISCSSNHQSMITVFSNAVRTYLSLETNELNFEILFLQNYF